MIKNICKNKECKLYDPNFANNCRVIREIKSCRILYPEGIQTKRKIKKDGQK
jgi:hypothetical protein